MQDLTIRFEGLDTTFHNLVDQKGFITSVLGKKYKLHILTEGDEEPDVLIYSWLNLNHLKWRNCIRIYLSMEMDFPDFNLCDYALGNVAIDLGKRYMRLPNYVYYNDMLCRYEKEKVFIDKTAALQRDFCSVVVSNSDYRDPILFKFYDQLNNYKPIASGGKWHNNTGGPIGDKLNFIRKYKFHLAFENSHIDGYVTEKLLEPLFANTIPIYWGSSSVKEDFGEKGYINISDFDSVDQAVAYIKEIDNNDELYWRILQERSLPSRTYDEWCDAVLNFLVEAIHLGKQLPKNSLYQFIHQEHYLVYALRENFLIKIYRKWLNIWYELKSRLNKSK